MGCLFSDQIETPTNIYGVIEMRIRNEVVAHRDLLKVPEGQTTCLVSAQSCLHGVHKSLLEATTSVK